MGLEMGSAVLLIVWEMLRNGFVSLKELFLNADHCVGTGSSLFSMEKPVMMGIMIDKAVTYFVTEQFQVSTVRLYIQTEQLIVQKFVETERLLVLKIVMMGTIPITLDVHLDVNLVH